MSNSRLQDLLTLAYVPRWSVIPVLRPQSVAEHSYNVAVLAAEIADKLGFAHRRAAIAYHALVHDGPEAMTGDFPSTVKEHFPPNCLDTVERMLSPWHWDEERRALPTEYAIVRIADKLEAILYISRWGVGVTADAALKRDKEECSRRIGEARARFGWPDLPAIVNGIIKSLGQSYSVLPDPPPTPPVVSPPEVPPPVPVPEG